MKESSQSRIEISSADDVQTCVAGSHGGGLGISVPPATTDADSAHTKSATAVSLFTVASPFCEGRQNKLTIITPVFSEHTSHFSKLLLSNPAEALHFCDLMLARLNPEDATEHLRWSNNSGAALRRLGDARSAMRLQLFSRPFLRNVTDLFSLGCYQHGAGKTLAMVGEYGGSLLAFDEARRLYTLAGQDSCAAGADNNAAVMLMDAGRFDEARARAERARAVYLSFGLTELVGEVADTMSQIWKRESEALR